MKKRALVIDLDGTLFTINTFHFFIKYLIGFCIQHFKIVLLVKLSFAIITRLYASHAKMKYKILRLLKNRNDIDYNAFVNSISPKKRFIPQLQDPIFDIKILATAAPSCYANIIAKNEGLVCLGTDIKNTKFNQAFENSKTNKKENVLKYLENQGVHKVDTFITDHIDDLPLIKIAANNILVNPNVELQEELKQNSISFEVIS
ncbi:haloacid dehalogenase-like hydrolase [Flavivirga eckloniae]|nr:haloacid dehalogenase-like hydrolase [Flavivirga eckloniae]